MSGNTASALAAVCLVIVKAHPAHPGRSELVGRVIQSAAKKCHMPVGKWSTFMIVLYLSVDPADMKYTIGELPAKMPQIYCAMIH